MSQRIITGFHAIEEKILKAKDSNSAKGISVFYSKPGPRVKKILSVASEIGISCSQCDAKKLDELVNKKTGGFYYGKCMEIFPWRCLGKERKCT